MGLLNKGIMAMEELLLKTQMNVSIFSSMVKKAPILEPMLLLYGPSCFFSRCINLEQIIICGDTKIIVN